MARFRFKLEPLFTLRRAAEDTCQRQLAMALRQRMIVHDQLRQMQQTITASKHQLGRSLVGNVDLSQTSQFARYSSQVTQRAHAMVNRLAGIEKQVEVARAKLEKAMRARKALELLRDKQKHAWEQQQARQEAARLDEIAVQQYARRMVVGVAE